MGNIVAQFCGKGTMNWYPNVQIFGIGIREALSASPNNMEATFNYLIPLHFLLQIWNYISRKILLDFKPYFGIILPLHGKLQFDNSGIYKLYYYYYYCR